MFRKNTKKERSLSWKTFLKFYTTFRIPWICLVASALCAMAIKELTLMMVPYTSKIMTGAITEGGFLVAFVLLNMANAMAESISEALLDMTRIRTQRNVNRAVWRRMLRLPMSYYNRQEPQQLISRVTKDTEGAVGTLNCALQVITVVFGVVESFRRMYAVYKSLAMIMLLGIPVVMLTGTLVGRMNYKVIYIQNKALSAMTNFFAERLPGVLHIKTNNMEEEEVKRGIEENDRRYKEEIKAEKLFIVSSPLSTLGNYLFEIVLLVAAAALVRMGKMKTFQMVSLYNYYILFMSNALMLVAVWQGIKTSQGASAVTASLMSEPMEELDQGEALKETNETISFEHVSFSYDGRHQILKDVSFQIPKGKKTVIVGENGSGKSTILKLLERFEEPTSGQIYLGGTPLEQLQLKALRNQLGYLSQGDQIVTGTIRENLTYGLERPCSEEEIKEAAKQAYAYAFIQEKEEGFEAHMSNFDEKISGGEMQRVAIARMFLKKPLYLIMDEATSGIDAITKGFVMDHIDAMMQDKTVIMISHDLDEMITADHIVVLKDGEIEASGSYEEVYTQSSLVQAWADEATD